MPLRGSSKPRVACCETTFYNASPCSQLVAFPVWYCPLSVLSTRSCSISWHSFSPWHNLSKLSSAHGLPKELLLVVKVVQVVFPCVHVDSAGNVFKAKRCSLLFPLQQPLVSMGLEEAISWRSVVHCCKGCLSCFPLCPRDFLSRQRENYMRVYGFSFGRTSGESYFCSRKRVITLKRKSGL